MECLEAIDVGLSCGVGVGDRRSEVDPVRVRGRFSRG